MALLQTEVLELECTVVKTEDENQSLDSPGSVSGPGLTSEDSVGHMVEMVEDGELKTEEDHLSTHSGDDDNSSLHVSGHAFMQLPNPLCGDEELIKMEDPDDNGYGPEQLIPVTTENSQDASDESITTMASIEIDVAQSPHPALTNNLQNVDTGKVSNSTKCEEISKKSESKDQPTSREILSTSTATASTSTTITTTSTRTRFLKRSSQAKGKEKKGLECSKCEEVFSDQASLLQHRKLEHRWNKLHECSICGKSIKGNYQFKNHMNIHKGEKPYACTMCDMSFYSSSALNSHKNWHSKKFQCSICDAVCKSSAHLEVHMRSHTGVRPYPCGVCKKVFFSNSQLVVHARIHSGECPFQCNTCGKSFHNASYFRRHEKKHTGQTPDKHICPVCGKSFNEKRYFEGHLGRHKGDTPFQCSLCDRAYPGLYGLTAHYRKFHRVRAIRHSSEYQCVVCNEIFQCGKEVKTHMEENHAGNGADFIMDLDGGQLSDACTSRLKAEEKSLEKSEIVTTTPADDEKGSASRCQCPVCGKTLSRKSYLVTHMRVHSGEKPHHCAICGKGFAKKNVVLVHMKKCHTGDLKHNKCLTCGKNFPTPRALTQHSRIHSDGSYGCPMCEKTFACSSAVKNHLQVHFGKRHKCSTCGKTYSSSQYLKVHISRQTCQPSDFSGHIPGDPEKFLVPDELLKIPGKQEQF